MELHRVCRIVVGPAKICGQLGSATGVPNHADTRYSNSGEADDSAFRQLVDCGLI